MLGLPGARRACEILQILGLLKLKIRLKAKIVHRNNRFLRHLGILMSLTGRANMLRLIVSTRNLGVLGLLGLLGFLGPAEPLTSSGYSEFIAKIALKQPNGIPRVLRIPRTFRNPRTRRLLAPPEDFWISADS